MKNSRSKVTSMNGTIWLTDQQKLIIDAIVRPLDAERLVCSPECPFCYEGVLPESLKAHIAFSCTMAPPEVKAEMQQHS